MDIRILITAALLISLGFAAAGQVQAGSRCFDFEVFPNPALTTQQAIARVTCSCQSPQELPTITITENTIEISYRANTLCAVPPEPPTYEFVLGRLDPGIYQVIHAPTEFFSGNPLATDETEFKVISASVSTFHHGTAKLLLTIALLLIGLHIFAREKRKLEGNV